MDNDQSPGIKQKITRSKVGKPKLEQKITKSKVGRPKDIKNTLLKPSNIWTANKTATRFITYLSSIGRINIEKQGKARDQTTSRNKQRSQQRNTVIKSLKQYFHLQSEGVLYFFLRRVSLEPIIKDGQLCLPKDSTDKYDDFLSKYQALKLVIHLLDKQFYQELKGYLRSEKQVEISENPNLDQQQQVIQCAVAHFLIANNKVVTDQAFGELSEQERVQIQVTAVGYVSSILEILNNGNEYQDDNQQLGNTIALEASYSYLVPMNQVDSLPDDSII